MASPHEQNAHTRRRRNGGATLKRRLRRRGRYGRSKPGVDLSHQTLASARNRLRVRRCLVGAQLLPWRSGARRPDSNAGREPKGAIALPVFRVLAITDLHKKT